LVTWTRQRARRRNAFGLPSRLNAKEGGLIGQVILTRYLEPSDDPEKTEIKLRKGHLYAFPLEAFEQKRAIMVGRMAAGEPVLIDGEEPQGPPQAGCGPNLVSNPTTPQR
jgi:hypothetical protein